MRVWSTHRPVSIGTYPREYGVKKIVNFNGRMMVPEINAYAWGYIDYEQDLPKEEQDHYDLRPEIKPTDPRLESAAKALVKAIEKGNMGRITKILDKVYMMGLIEDEEEIVTLAGKYMR